MASPRLRPLRIELTSGLAPSFDSLVLHDARLLGQVTQAANACRMDVVDAQGNVTSVVKRDAAPKPRRNDGGASSSQTVTQVKGSDDADNSPVTGTACFVKGSCSATGATVYVKGSCSETGTTLGVPSYGGGTYQDAAAMELESQGAEPADDALPAVELFNRVRKQTHKPRGSSAAAKAKAAAKLHTDRIVQRIGSAAGTPADRPSAAQRLEAIRNRLRANAS